jgi:hypothetical protein
MFPTIYTMLLMPTERDDEYGNPRRKILTQSPRWQSWERHDKTTDLLSVLIIVGKKTTF